MPQYNIHCYNKFHYASLCNKAREKPLEQLEREITQYELAKENRRNQSLVKRLIDHWTYSGPITHEEYDLSKRILEERYK